MPKKVIPKKMPAKRTSNKIPQLLRGFKDILPVDQQYWRLVRQAGQDFADGYSFGKISLPILEESNLFVRSIGKDTDIVQKEMFTYNDVSEGSVTLRPEFTASVARAYINHGMFNLPQPVKFYYFGPLFRRDKPQAGRYRQFYQLGYEVIGDTGAIIDAQLIVLAYNLLNQLGLKNFTIQINSIGTPESRKEYKKELVSYYKSKRKMLCENCKKRLLKNPLRLLDCKEASCQPFKGEAPQIVDWLDDESKAHFMKVLEYLDGLDIPYILNPYLVRGLDYYTKTVFEIWPAEKEDGAQGALGGGGRYDGLIETLGGRPTPAAGFSLGVERLIIQLKEQEVKLTNHQAPKIFLAQIGDQAKIKAMKLFEQLRADGIIAAENFTKDGLKNQLEIANNLGVRYVLILGQKEVVDGTILLRDMESGVQEVFDFNKTLQEIKKKLSAN
ncbi:MAG: histidine--tRNA ligase [Candidatus Buchananbacteria bacterium]|nr:histidine--tRNA ligase [Candidatus Buchananbacteria bacterium]